MSCFCDLLRDIVVSFIEHDLNSVDFLKWKQYSWEFITNFLSFQLKLRDFTLVEGFHISIDF